MLLRRCALGAGVGFPLADEILRRHQVPLVARSPASLQASGTDGARPPGCGAVRPDVARGRTAAGPMAPCPSVPFSLPGGRSSAPAARRGRPRC
jgi:hypothetical protein